MRRLWILAAVIAAMLAGGVTPAAASPIAQLPGSLGCLNPGGGGGCADSGPLTGARAIAVAPDGRTVYVAQPAGDSIVVFDADPATGALVRRPGGVTGNGLENVFSVAISADGNWLVAGSNGTQAPGTDTPAPDAGVSLFRRDPATGTLAPSACMTQAGASGCADGHGLGAVIGVDISRDGKHVYAASWVGGAQQRGYLAALRRDGAALSQSAGPDGCLASGSADGCGRARALRGPTGIALAPDGRHVYVATWIDESVATFDRRLSDGSLDQTACVAAASVAATLACTPVDFLDNPGDRAGATSQPAGLAFRDDRSLYVAERRGRTIGLLDRDPRSGSLERHPGRGGCVTSQPALSGACRSARRMSDPAGAERGSLFETQGIAAQGSTLVAGTLVNTAATSYDLAAGGGITPVDGPRGCIAPSTALDCAAGNGFAGGLAPIDLAFSPNGRFVYAALMRPFDVAAAGAILVLGHPVAGRPLDGGAGGGGGAGAGGGDGGSLERITATVKPSWVKRRSHVVLRRLRIAKVPAGARVEVRCMGRRCPFKQRRFRVGMGRVDASRAVRRGRLRPNARIQVRITKPNAIGRVFVYEVRRKGLPKRKVRCLPPGTSTPAAC